MSGILSPAQTARVTLKAERWLLQQRDSEIKFALMRFAEPPHALSRGTSRVAFPLSIACKSAGGSRIFRIVSI